MTPNTLLKKLDQGAVVTSMIVRLIGSPQIARIAHSAGFDTLYVDLEHCPFSLETTANICLEALSAGITPMVRVPDIGSIQRVVDLGALGVIVPHVTTAAEARAAVRAAKYPPLGKRGATSSLPQLQFRNLPAEEAQRMVNDATMVVVMIEDQAALDNVEEIAAVEGVDLLHIGTNDLTASMGLPGQYSHPAVDAAYARVIAACRPHGKHVGTGGMSAYPDRVATVVRMGVRYISTGADVGFVMSECSRRVAAVRALPT